MSNRSCIALLILLVAFSSGSRADAPDPRCGSRCLIVAMGAFGVELLSLESLEKTLGPPGDKGYDLDQLGREAQRRGLHTLGVETTFDNLGRREEPFACITLVDDDHFVLLYDLDDDFAYYVDPPGETRMPLDSFGVLWSGKCLLISDVPLTDEAELNRRIAWRRAGWMAAMIAGSLAIVFLSVVLVRRRRRSATTALVACMVLAHAGCGPRALDTPSRPRPSRAGGLVIEPLEHDLGDVSRASLSSTCEAKTILRNTGNRAVRILEVAKSCSCTETRLSGTVVEPGASVELIAEMTLGNSEEVRGASISIRTDDASRPVQRVTYRWRTRSILHANPPAASLGKVRPGDAGRTRIELLAANRILCEKCTLEVASRTPELTVEPRLIDFSPPRAGGPPEDVVVGSLSLASIPAFEVGGRSGIIEATLRCGDEPRARLDIPVNWTIAAAYQVIPSRVSFGPVRPGREVSSRLVVISETERIFRLRSARLESGVLEAFEKGENSRSSHNCKFVVRVPEAPGLWSSTLALETDDPEHPVLRVPVSALVEAVRPDEAPLAVPSSETTK